MAMRDGARLFFDLFKLRIGLPIGLTALAGLAVTPGPPLAGWQVAVLALAVVMASASAGAFNQFVERDMDARMGRTRRRPFVTGRLQHGPAWLVLIAAMAIAAVGAAALALNAYAALYVFLGAFFYAVVYTVWLKRRTWLNIVIGGLAGSFAVLAGSAAAAPGELPAAPFLLATVLFLWTPPHFWSLAIAYRSDYEAVGVPMLPCVVGDARCAQIIFRSAMALVAVSLLPAFFGLGWVYLAGAAAGGAWFLAKSAALARSPSRATAMANFHASLLQLGLLLGAALLDGAVAG
ncbi:heme o synthase [Pelomicrobium sp. P1]|uniref:heme o synthase n=2 Tax=unclassified Pelomicrobium TaxID=2815318 RepID=UPI0040567596